MSPSPSLAQSSGSSTRSFAGVSGRPPRPGLPGRPAPPAGIPNLQTGTAERSHSLGFPSCARYILAKEVEVVHWQEREQPPREGWGSLLSPPLQSPQAGGGRATCGLSCTQSRPPSDPRLSRSTLPPFSAGKVRRCSRLLCVCLLTPGVASRGLSYRTALTGKEQVHSCCPFGFCFSFPVLLLVLRHGSA